MCPSSWMTMRKIRPSSATMTVIANLRPRVFRPRRAPNRPRLLWLPCSASSRSLAPPRGPPRSHPLSVGSYPAVKESLHSERQTPEYIIPRLLEAPADSVEGYRLGPDVDPLGIEQAEGYGQPHVRQRSVQHDRAVLEESAPVHHRLAVYDDPYVFERNAEEVVRLYHLETLVHHGGRVYGDLRPHPPRGVSERILGTGCEEPCFLVGEEGPSRRRQQYTRDLLLPPPFQALEDRRVLGIYREYAVVRREAHNPLAPRDERFLVGEGDAVARLEGADGRREAGEADYSVEDDVGWHAGQLFGRAGSGMDFGGETLEGACCFGRFQGHVFGFELGRLDGERLGVACGGEADEIEAFRISTDDVEGLAAGTARRTEDGKAASHVGVGSNLIRVGRYSIPPEP